MKSRIREIRKAKGLTLAEVAARIKPEPSTAQTIGRLETGMRTLSVEWLKKIADALSVEPSELIILPEQADCPILGEIGHFGEVESTPIEMIDLRLAARDPLALRVTVAQGGYEPGDVLILDRVASDALHTLDGHNGFIESVDGLTFFGRVVTQDDGKLTMLTASPSAQVHRDLRPAWGAKLVMLLRQYQA